MISQTAPSNGTDHSNRGREWENQLETVHEFYRRRGLCDVVKNPSEWLFIGPAKYANFTRSGKYDRGMFATTDNGRQLMRTRSDVDFSGGGRGFSICFDAKACGGTGKTFPLSNIAAHQIQRLRASVACGCIAGFMIYMSEHERVFFVPVEYVDSRWMELQKQTGRRAKVGTASLSMADMETNGTEILKGKMNGLWDWYPALVGDGRSL